MNSQNLRHGCCGRGCCRAIKRHRHTLKQKTKIIENHQYKQGKIGYLFSQSRHIRGDILEILQHLLQIANLIRLHLAHLDAEEGLQLLEVIARASIMHEVDGDALTNTSLFRVACMSASVWLIMHVPYSPFKW